MSGKLFGKIFGKILASVEGVPDDAKGKIMEEVEKHADAELQNPPRIALIGTSGVGKTTTINALFGTNLPISHFKACTQESEEITIPTKNGDIIFHDMPGLGEDIDTDEKHKKTYAEILPKCDVVMWVLVANGAGRAMTFDQIMLRDVVRPHVNKLVIGINQVDLMEGKWIDAANIPSEKQMSNIEQRLIDVQEKLCKVVPELEKDKILYYSAEKRFRLYQLFEALINACSVERAWVLGSRKEIADCTELIDPEILEAMKQVVTTERKES